MDVCSTASPKNELPKNFLQKHICDNALINQDSFKMKKIILLSLIALISSCQNSKVNYTYPENPKNIRNGRAGKFFDNKNIFSSNKKTSALKTQANQLWISSIEIISELLPISVADENSGLIVTQWYQDEQNKNDHQRSRMKINLLVKGKEIKEENLSLTIFRQTKNNKNIWVDEQSSNQSLSAQTIRDKIIEKAKSK